MNRPNIKEYLKIKFEEYGIDKKVWEYKNEDLFYFAVLFKEGMDLGNSSKHLFDIAQSIVEKDGYSVYRYKKLLSRINELKNGDTGLADFTSGKELAEYLLN